MRDSAFGSVGVLSLLLLFLPALAVTVRRLHDANRSGWLYLIVFIPFIGTISFADLVLQPRRRRS
jgi:uncharacterized membrane protein YhaH (DUF805 family)